MGVYEVKHQPRTRELQRLQQMAPQEPFVVGRDPPAQVQAGQDQRGPAVGVLEAQRGRIQRPMDRLGHVVGRATPHPRVDAQRRRNIAPGAPIRPRKEGSRTSQAFPPGDCPDFRSPGDCPDFRSPGDCPDFRPTKMGLSPSVAARSLFPKPLLLIVRSRGCGDQGKPAVAEQGAADHVAVSRITHVGDVKGDFLGRHEFPDRHLRLDVLASVGVFGPVLPAHAGVDPARGDLVHQDVVGSILGGHAQHEHAEPGLGHAIGRHVGVRRMGSPGTQEDDAPRTPLGQQPPRAGLGHVKCPHEVDVQQMPQGLARQFPYRHDLRNGGVGDDERRQAQVALDLADPTIDRLGVGHVDQVEPAAAAELPQGLHERRRPALVAAAAQAHVGAARGQLQGAGPGDIAQPAADDRHLTGQR